MDSDFDYFQEIARSGFGDMLHDLERNNKYYEGIKKAIAKLRARNEEVHVLDIGTGSGLLSMMAIRLGADSVTACEAFRPMADTAEKIFEANGMQYRVALIKRRSTDITIGVDMAQRANLLVTEVFDTELIGEGAIEIFNHAHEELLTKDCFVVPHLSRCYVQPVQSPFLEGFNRIKSIANLDGEVIIRPPKQFQECPGTAFLFDVQLSQFHDKYTSAAEPQVVMEFDFSGEPIELDRKSVKAFTPTIPGGTVQALFFWWDLLMDKEGEVVLSCAPSWAHPDFAEHRKEAAKSVQDKDVIPWRDHWMQAIYFPPKPLNITAGKDFYVVSTHGEFSWWFTVESDPSAVPETVKEPFCTCGLHQSCSRYRIGQMNYSLRNKEFLKYFENEESLTGGTVMALSHGSLVSLSAAGFKPKHLYMVDDSSLGHSLVRDFVKENNLESVEIVSNVEKVPLEEVTHIVGEPYFANNILPWHSFRFANILRRFSGQLREDVKIFPSKFSLFAIPVQLLHLHKIRYPMENINTFDVRELDRLLEHAYTVADDNLEPQSLIEYPCVALSEPIHVHSIKLEEFVKMEGTPKLQITVTARNEVPDSVCNALVLYTVWNDKKALSSGPVSDPVAGELVNWDVFSKQGIHFIKNPSRLGRELNIEVTFCPEKLFVDCIVT